MSYLKKYGSAKSTRKFQAGGELAPAPAPGPGPDQGGGGSQEEQILALAEAAVAGDQQAAAELGMILAPMILQEVQAQAGAAGAPAEAEAAQPVFRKGGVFAGVIRR